MKDINIGEIEGVNTENVSTGRVSIGKSAKLNTYFQNIKLCVEKCHKGAKLPIIKTSKSAGYDLHSVEGGVVGPRSHTLVKTGIKMKIPDGYCGQIWSRSGLSVKHGIETGAGIIDSDYSGEIGVVLHNYTDEEFKYEAGTRIAQILLVPVYTPKIYECENINQYHDGDRGENGFGSTGMK